MFTRLRWLMNRLEWERIEKLFLALTRRHNCFVHWLFVWLGLSGFRHRPAYWTIVYVYNTNSVSGKRQSVVTVMCGSCCCGMTLVHCIPFMELLKSYIYLFLILWQKKKKKNHVNLWSLVIKSSSVSQLSIQFLHFLRTFLHIVLYGNTTLYWFGLNKMCRPAFCCSWQLLRTVQDTAALPLRTPSGPGQFVPLW